MAFEFVAPVIDKQKALAYLTDAVDRVEDGRMHRVARGMKALKKKQPSDCRWKLLTGRTHQDIARVMCAVNDTLANFCGYDSMNKEGGKYLERWLCDSCSDTHLVSKDYIIFFHNVVLMRQSKGES